MHEINVLYCFDSRFARMAAISIYSLLKNQNKTTKCNLYIMCPPRTVLRHHITAIAQQFGATITWHVVKKCPYSKNDFQYWDNVIFYRLMAWNAFPGINKMLYLDCDTIVMHDLSELFMTDISDHAVAGVIDASSEYVIELAKSQHLGNFMHYYTNNAPYINSGVLLMNMDKMREFNDKFLSVDIPLEYPVSDLLNYVLCGKIKYLDEKYNKCPATMADNDKNYNLDDYLIIHCYTGKPYIYEQSLKKIFSLFCKMANEIGMHQTDFVKDEIKYSKKRYSSRTVIPFLRVNQQKQLRFFGIRIA